LAQAQSQITSFPENTGLTSERQRRILRLALNILEFTLLVLLGSFFAGFLGSLTGLGGGVVFGLVLLHSA
jgi:hypothetical protein